MGKVDGFEKLMCWQAARQLVALTYSVCRGGLLSKDFEMSSQIRRAVLSVMSNIAEGFGRESHKEFIRFLDISQSSAMEVKSIAYVLEDLKYISPEQIILIMEKADEARYLTRGLMKYLRSTPKRPSP
ncbi:MAG TPA: four helix bundle protein [Cyclobacteriaceae bacterium]|nr:four helix bundle protein [Cyclobacteriaceae bacterium]